MPDIIIIDDEVQIAELLAEVGQMSGYQTTTYTEARQFLKNPSSDGGANSGANSIIFLDLSMPDIDGIEVITELGKRQCKAGIFLMSGFDTELLNSAKHIALEYDLNIIETLNKPMDIGYVSQRLEDLKTTL